MVTVCTWNLSSIAYKLRPEVMFYQIIRYLHTLLYQRGTKWWLLFSVHENAGKTDVNHYKPYSESKEWRGNRIETHGRPKLTWCSLGCLKFICWLDEHFPVHVHVWVLPQNWPEKFHSSSILFLSTPRETPRHHRVSFQAVPTCLHSHMQRWQWGL